MLRGLWYFFSGHITIQFGVRHAFVPILFSENTWIGLEDFLHDGRFVWVTSQETPEFTVWGPGEPNDDRGNEDCAHIWFPTSSRGLWNDGSCELQYWALCERPYVL
jgi:hypothetical protein